jgi:dTDP-4-amino-4,6-dideoxygalactose transaminase
MINDRQRVAAIYDRELRMLKGLTTVAIPAEGVCNYYKYLVVLNQRQDRKGLKTLLREMYGVSLAGEVYEEPLHKQPVFEPYASGALPVSEDYCARHLCLPVFSGMEEADAYQVVQALKQVIG